LSVPYALYAANSPAGATGPAGPQGPAGAAGLNGQDGAQGPQGSTGNDGAQGPQGPTGADGAQGPQGATGAVGPQGATGATGAQGPTGIGVAGPTGPTGPGASINGTTNSVPKFTNATTLGNSQITDNGTKVTIGTAFSGFGLLDVAGGVTTNAAGNGGFYALQGGNFFGGIEPFGGTWDIYSASGNNITLTPGGGATAMTLLTTNGNVGIGTATPGAKLEVNGQVKITGGAPGAGKVLTSDATGLATWQTPTGAVGPTGPTGAAGPAGPTGATGAAAPTPTFFTLNAGGTAARPTVASTWEFIGPTAVVNITSTTSRITGSAVWAAASATVGAILGPVRVDLCRQTGGAGVLTNFSGGNYMDIEIDDRRKPIAVTGTITGLAAGSYTVGMCVFAATINILNDNDWANGWLMVNP